VQFPETRNSALRAIRSESETERARGLGRLAEAYWRPVYTYLRLQWRKPHDEAADLTQQFFETVLRNDVLQKFDPRKARLRTFVRACVDGLARNAQRSLHRQKLNFDFARLENELPERTAKSPEELFEQEWARGLFAAALERLPELESRLFRAYELGGEDLSYADLAKRHAMFSY
jgi:RNA polymerase sigma factor (sigma-70 family)